MALLEVNNLEVRYGVITALKGISFEVKGFLKCATPTTATFFSS